MSPISYEAVSLAIRHRTLVIPKYSLFRVSVTEKTPDVWCFGFRQSYYRPTALRAGSLIDRRPNNGHLELSGSQTHETGSRLFINYLPKWVVNIGEYLP
jgi:hypothetical protein